MGFFDFFRHKKTEKNKGVVPGSDVNAKKPPQDPLDREIETIFNLLTEEWGADQIVIKAGKLDAMALLRSEKRGERVLALERLVEADPTIDHVPSDKEIPEILTILSEHIADQIARRTMEDKIEQQIEKKLEENHNDYVKDLRKQVLDEEKGGVESPQAAKKREKLEALEKISLTQSVLEILRPKSLEEIVGQEAAVKALLAKLSSPYPQHLILYGPPGIGKTTAARLVLEAAKKVSHAPFAPEAPFIETDGTTLRWDPRDMTNPLLGSVHDPIYQGARRDLADNGVPEPKPGLVTDAHGGVLFIDEIGEMDELLQNKLLKVLEDKRAYFESAYFDPTDEKVPPYIRKLFEEGAPADFVLIGATTRDASHVNPALRSRCAAIYFEPLTPAQIVELLLKAAEKLSAVLSREAAELISEYTVEGRKAVGILADAYSLAVSRLSDDEPAENVVILLDDIREVARVSRLYQYVTKKASDTAMQGHIFGLGVSGFLGSVIEIEAVAFPAREKGKGTVRFNETAGSMAKDSVFNAASVLRSITGQDLADFDVHINVIGGGNIDGPSAGTAILSALVSAVTGRKIRQNVAVTGEIALNGNVRPVGGVPEKAYGAAQAGMKTMVIPWENRSDIPLGHLGMDIHPVKTAEEAFALIFEEQENKETEE
ncbi:MAG: Lon family ATP-dependent protease [Selenomonadaceae bacterium]|nr:Lon family ATP-dependent protease [Selenomonadaceae bacterium]